jgi:hypothetical protein
MIASKPMTIRAWPARSLVGAFVTASITLIVSSQLALAQFTAAGLSVGPGGSNMHMSGPGGDREPRANFNPHHEPGGTQSGGQFARSGGGGPSSGVSALIAKAAKRAPSGQGAAGRTQPLDVVFKQPGLTVTSFGADKGLAEVITRVYMAAPERLRNVIAPVEIGVFESPARYRALTGNAASGMTSGFQVQDKENGTELSRALLNFTKRALP